MACKTDLPPMQKDADYFSRDFWLQWRESSRFNALLQRRGLFPHGRNKCYDWVEWVHQTSPEEGLPLKTARATGESYEFLNKECGFIGGHVWLEAETSDGRRYIADGTAGQIDPRFPLGFYGNLAEASETLQQAYKERTFWHSVFEKKSA